MNQILSNLVSVDVIVVRINDKFSASVVGFANY